MGFHPENRLVVGLSSVEKNLVLSCFPKGSKIIESKFFNNYNLPCPIKVRIQLPNKKIENVVLRKSRNGDVRKEAEILKSLKNLHLPVPKVLHDAQKINNQEYASVLEYIKGTNLQYFSMRSKKNIKKAKDLLFDAIMRMAELTYKIKKCNLSKDLIEKTLISQLDEIKNSKPWNSESLFKESVKKLEPILKNIDMPLIFTNGDYQPANFITNGKEIVGLLDFDKACFQDLLIGITKFPIYGLRPLNKAGFVKKFIKETGFTEKEFMPRLALGCLITLQKEIPVKYGNKETINYRKHVIKLLKKSLNEI
ncbi:MAG: phosphotransferase [Nanoarchaeota archaeon]